MINWLTKYRIAIMVTLTLVILVVVLPLITYITEYNKTKVSASDVFSINSEYVEVSKDDFLKEFSNFELYLSQYKDAYYDEDGVKNNGKYVFHINATRTDSTTLAGTSMTATIGLAANWVGYSGNSDYTKATTSSTTVTYGGAKDYSGKDITFSSYTTVWPQKGRLLFTKVNSPDVFVYITFTKKNDTKTYYTVWQTSLKKTITDATVVLE